MLWKLHFGPGAAWRKPGPEWRTVDVDPRRGDVVIDFNRFTHLPLPDGSVASIYGSHVFEHMSLYAAPRVFAECHRVLAPGGYLRIVLPDVRKSLEQYLAGNADFPLFRRRVDALRRRFGYKRVSLLETMKSDFISPTGQPGLLGEEGLAHQNAWDFEALALDLERVGFAADNIHQVRFQVSSCPDFAFEGTYPSEANEHDRSLYVEACK
jgi:SAM-dependent methyltransferase